MGLDVDPFTSTASLPGWLASLAGPALLVAEVPQVLGVFDEVHPLLNPSLLIHPWWNQWPIFALCICTLTHLLLVVVFSGCLCLWEMA